MSSNYNYRRDKRTDAQFAKDISVRTKREKLLMTEWFGINIKYPNAELIDYGVDNSGGVISNSIKKKSDYLVKTDKDDLYEVKISPNNFITFKKGDVEYLRKNGNINLLVFVETDMWRDSLECSKDAKWFLMNTTSDLDWFVENANFAPQGHNGFGGKPTYRILLNEIEKKFEVKRLYD